MLISFSGVERVSEEPDKTGFFVVLKSCPVPNWEWQFPSLNLLPKSES
jgi:hypothetical protein